MKNGALRLSEPGAPVPFFREPGKWVKTKEWRKDLIEAMDAWI
jgi:hypothetical protein